MESIFLSLDPMECIFEFDVTGFWIHPEHKLYKRMSRTLQFHLRPPQTRGNSSNINNSSAADSTTTPSSSSSSTSPSSHSVNYINASQSISTRVTHQQLVTSRGRLRTTHRQDPSGRQTLQLRIPVKESSVFDHNPLMVFAAIQVRVSRRTGLQQAPIHLSRWLDRFVVDIGDCCGTLKGFLLTKPPRNTPNNVFYDGL